MARTFGLRAALLSLMAVTSIVACRGASPPSASIALCGIEVPMASGYVIAREFDEDGYRTVDVMSASAGQPSSATAVFGEFDSGSFEVELNARRVGPGVTSFGAIKRRSTGCEVIFTLYEPPSVADIVEGAAWVLSVSWPKDA